MLLWALTFKLSDIFGPEPKDFNLSNIGPALAKVTDLLFGFSGAVALIFLLWGGVQYITAGGSSEQAGKAKSTITWAFIGVVVILAAFAIVKYFSGIVIKESPIK